MSGISIHELVISKYSMSLLVDGIFESSVGEGPGVKRVNGFNTDRRCDDRRVYGGGLDNTWVSVRDTVPHQYLTGLDTL